LASIVCDTRQAKRLFPLFGATGILGLSIGGIITKPLVDVVGTDNLLIAWALGLISVFFIASYLIRSVNIKQRPRVQKQRSMLRAIQEGYRFTKNSPLFKWMAIAAVFFAILYFFLVFPFSVAASEQFPDEEALAGFLGVFQGISSAISILASLFLANRLYAKFGLMTTIVIYPIIYFIGFSILSINAAFSVLVAYQFVQIV